MIRWSVFFIFVFGLPLLQAQDRCGTLDHSWQQERSQYSVSRSERLIVPVIFHVVYQKGTDPVSKERILSQIDALNRDFNLQHGELFKVPAAFWPLIQSAEIEFCLATKVENGGITFTETDIPFIGQDIFSDGRRTVHYSILGGKDAFEPEKVINIWIADLQSFTGIATFHNTTLPEEDGIIMDPDFFGNTGGELGEFAEGRTLVHEMGHYFGLRHPWVNAGCETDDGIEDTPLQDGPYLDCPDPGQTRSCGSLDMSQNYMQFNDDPCLLYFTKDQVNFMRSVLLNERSGLRMGAEQFCGSEIQSELSLQMFFHPLKQHIQVYGLSPRETAQIQVWNTSGQLALDRSLLGQFVPEIGLEHLPSGVYFARLTTPNQQQTLKFIKHE